MDTFLAHPLIRDRAVPLLVAIASLLIPFSWILSAYIVTSYGHFSMAMLYQARAGKVNRQFLLIVFLMLLLALVYFMFWGDWKFLLLLTNLLFGLHFAFDEYILKREKLTLDRVLTVFGFTAIIFFIILTVFYPALHPFELPVMLLLASGIITRLFFSRTKPSATDTYLWWVEGLALIFAFGFGVPDRILGMVIMLHTYNWMADYGARVQGNPERRTRYWKDTIITTAIPVTLFFMYAVWHVQAFQFLFVPKYFYIFALTHFALTATIPRFFLKPPIFFQVIK